MKKKRLISILLLLTFIPFITAGCWDRRELEDQAFVIAIGLDKGRDNTLLVTFRIGIPSKSGLGQSGGGGGGGGEGSIAKQSSLLTTVEAPTVPAAIILAQGYVNRELSLLHTKGIIFGEAFAKEGVGQIMGILARYRELRRNIFVGVCKGNAYEVLNNNAPDLEKSYAKWWEGVKLISSSQATQPGTLLHNFLSDSERIEKEATMIYFAANEKSKDDPGEIRAPASFTKGVLGVKAGEIPRSGGNPVEFMGTAVFKGDKLDHTLNLTETRSYRMLTGEFKRTFYIFPIPEEKGKYVSIELKQGSVPTVKVSAKSSETVIDETLFLEGDLLSIQTRNNYTTNSAKMEKLNRFIEKMLESRLIELVKKEQKRVTDIFGYGNYAKRSFLTEPEWELLNWPEHFKTARVKIRVNFSIRRTGMQGDQPKLITAE